MSVAAPSKAPTILDFVRHGQTPYNAQRECPRTKKMTTMIQGSLDVKLSDLGVKQVETLAETLKGSYCCISIQKEF